MSINLRHPLPGAPLTAHFGYRPGFTENGIYIPPMLHNGTDFGAPAGTLIRAAHAGRVSYVGWDDLGGGWMVKVSAARFSTLYLHMREPSPLVRPGDAVRAGQGIGYVGMSGTATGPHLHFMLRLNGMDVNPYPYITATPPEEDEMSKAQYDAIMFQLGEIRKEQSKARQVTTWIKKRLGGSVKDGGTVTGLIRDAEAKTKPSA